MDFDISRKKINVFKIGNQYCFKEYFSEAENTVSNPGIDASGYEERLCLGTGYRGSVQDPILQ